MSREERRAHAALAASQASHALSELLSFVVDDSDRLSIATGGECIEMLLDAAKMAIEIIDAEAEETGGQSCEERNQVYGAISKFLEGWA